MLKLQYRAPIIDQMPSAEKLLSMTASAANMYEERFMASIRRRDKQNALANEERRK